MYSRLKDTKWCPNCNRPHVKRVRRFTEARICSICGHELVATPPDSHPYFRTFMHMFGDDKNFIEYIPNSDAAFWERDEALLDFGEMYAQASLIDPEHFKDGETIAYIVGYIKNLPLSVIPLIADKAKGVSGLSMGNISSTQVEEVLEQLKQN